MSVSANTANFSGVLVKRQYRPGQKYIQLVFKTTEGFRLSLSRNLQMVKSLSVGRTYEVKGPEYTIGDKTFVSEPTATLVKQEETKEATSISKRKLFLIISGIAVMLVIGVSISLMMTKKTPVSTTQPPSKNVSSSSSQSPAQATSGAATTSTQQSTSSSYTYTASTSSNKTAAKPSSNSNVSATPSSPSGSQGSSMGSSTSSGGSPGSTTGSPTGSSTPAGSSTPDPGSAAPDSSD